MGFIYIVLVTVVEAATVLQRVTFELKHTHDFHGILGKTAASLLFTASFNHTLRIIASCCLIFFIAF